MYLTNHFENVLILSTKNHVLPQETKNFEPEKHILFDFFMNGFILIMCYHLSR